MINLGKPVALANRTAILVMDEIGMDSSHEDPVEVAPPNAARQKVWVRESTISTINEKHRGVSIYGIWHTLLHNRVIKPAERPDALYLIESLEIALYVEGGVAMRSGFAAAGTLTFPSPIGLSEAIHIDADVAKLRAPPEEAIHPVESAKRRAKAAERLRVTAVLLTTPVLVLAYLVDAGLAQRAATRTEFMDQLSQQALTLTADLDLIKAQKRQPTPPAQTQAFELLWQVAQATEGLSIDNGSAAGPTWSARAVTVDETTLPQSVKVVSLQTGAFELHWAN